MSQDSTYLEDQIRECYGRVVYTHKTHEKCADILQTRNNRAKLTQIILSAVTTSGVLATTFGEEKWVGIATAVLALGSLILNTYLKKHDLGSLSQKHADTAIGLWNVRESYLCLLTDLRSKAITPTEAIKKRDALQSELRGLFKGSPRTISKAYKEASKALKEMEEMTFKAEEIDKFLPESLRKT